MAGSLYHWVLAGHLFAVIAWMAGLLYLPRLFVYHTRAAPGSQMDDTFQTMERRLLRGIMTPSMLAVWGFGVWMLALYPEWLGEGWLHAKLMLVVLMSAYHMVCAGWRRRFAEGRNTRPERFYRMVNEIPAVLLIAILILVVVKPF